MKLFAGKLAPESGTLRRHQLLKNGYYDAQSESDSLDPNRTVEEEILFSDPQMERTRARNICGSMMFEGDQALKRISVLSGGEKSRG